MSDLIAVAYPNVETAEAVRTRLRQLEQEHTIELEDAVIVARDANGATGALVDSGIDDRFTTDLGQKLTSGGAALIVLVRKVAPDHVLPEIEQYGGEIIRTSLDDESEARLREILTGIDRSVTAW